jgi:hypothetical protein
MPAKVEIPAPATTKAIVLNLLDGCMLSESMKKRARSIPYMSTKLRVTNQNKFFLPAINVTHRHARKVRIFL